MPAIPYALLTLLLAATPSPPTFAVTVQITLSPTAAAKLATLHEGIIVSATYAARARPGARKHADWIGRIDLGIEQVKAPGEPGSIQVTGTHIRRSRLAWTEGPVNLNINVISARLSGPDNILACDIFDGDLDHATAHPIPLHCSLITEQAPTKALN